MRADSLPRLVTLAGRYSLLLALTLIAAGCKTDTGPDDPTVLGAPPTEAYLGVEYYYNFGAYGGERILDFSLTNAPSWLALEDTSNKARPGIIMRGVPGLSGGGRGDADLGKQEDINLLTTDGKRAGVQPFDIEVKRNPLSLEADTLKEGTPSEVPEAAEDRCLVPELEFTGSHDYQINQFDESGAVTSTVSRTRETHPVLVKVALEQPSVTRVAVAFELSSDFDPTDCDQGFTPDHQRCEESEANRDNAIIGRDIVALGSDSRARLPIPDYLDYQQDENGNFTKGVVTLEPGITECYIRLEVVDDTVPEPSETLILTLTEVRSGLAALGPTDTGVRTSLVIDDNEPQVRLENKQGRQRDAVSVGNAREFVAVLSGDREGTVLARLAENEDSVAKAGDFIIKTRNDDNDWVENTTLEFPEGVERVPFLIEIPDDYSNTGANDRFLLLELDQRYQAGRENFAGSADDIELRVNINELVAPLVLNNTGDGFVPTDIEVGHEGRLLVAGYDTGNNDQVLVRIYDQKGSLLQEVAVSDSAVALDQPDPVIGFAERQVTVDNTRVARYEMVVAYTAESAIPDLDTKGGEDAVIGLYWFDSAQPAGSEFQNVWAFRTGTSGDDIARWVGINEGSGAVILAGETSGAWPEASRAGGFDSFLQRIDTERDGEDRLPAVAWTRQVGSSANEIVVAGSTATASPYLFGHTTGSIGGNTGFGGNDGFFFNASSADSTLSVRQVGSAGDELVTDALYSTNSIWLLGNSDRSYTVEDIDDESARLDAEPLSGTNGFILQYLPSGTPELAFSFGSEDRAGADSLTELLRYDGDLVAGGSTTGAFELNAGNGNRQPILARVNPDATREEPVEDSEDGDSGDDTVTVDDGNTNEDDDGDDAAEDDVIIVEFIDELWRQQFDLDRALIEALANYRDDEIVALERQIVGGEVQWTLRLYSGEGARLN